MVVPPRADVVVVGGGPAGSATASHLARAGLHVVLLDKARFPREKACAEYCSPGVVDALADLGALDRISAIEHRDLPAMRVVARGVELPLDFARYRPDSNRAIGIKRSILDAELLDLARESGVQIYEGIRAKQPIQQQGRVTGVIYRNGHGDRAINADFVVAADGLHSTLARCLGLERRVHWPRRLGLIARFANLSQPVLNGQMHVGDSIYSGISPVNESEINVSLVVPMGAKPNGESTADFYERELTRLPGVAKILKGARRVSNVRGLGPLGKRVARRSGKGFLLVGDAAGFFDPLTGEGIHRALRGGELAAQATLAALDHPERQPIGYEEARRSHFGDKERVCQIIQALISSPRVLNYTSTRAAGRTRVHKTLSGVLGDYDPAVDALRPQFLWDLFRP